MSNQCDAVLAPKSKHNDWLTAEELRSLTVPEIVKRLTDLQDLIARYAAESERIHQPVDAVMSAIRKTGVFYLLIPREHGGLEAGLEAFIDVLIPIAEVDASMAWTTAFSIHHQWLLTQFPNKTQEELRSALPYVTSAGSGFPPGTGAVVDGGFRVNGRYRYASGIMHSEWANAIVNVTINGKNVPYFVMVPIDEVTVYDTWHVDGMAGTGSHDIEFKDVFVPEHHAIKLEQLITGQLHHKNPLYRMPFAPFLALVAAAVMLGVAKQVVQRFRSRLAAPGPDGKLAEKPVAQVVLARADMDVVAAELLIRDAARRAESMAASNAQVAPVDDRVRLRTQIAYGAHLCLKAVRAVGDLSGSSAHLLSNPLQRAIRDAAMISTHAILEINACLELHGRVMIGLPPNYWYV